MYIIYGILPIKENEFSNNEKSEFIYDDAVRKICS